MTEEEVLAQLDAESEARTERVRAELRRVGRADLVAELDAKLRDGRLGLSGAGSAWHSISPAQRRALTLAKQGGGYFWRNPFNPHAYWLRVVGGSVVRVGRRTIRALCAHELLAWDGGAFDPENCAVLTERGRFVIAHGPEQAKKWGAA